MDSQLAIQKVTPPESSTHNSLRLLTWNLQVGITNLNLAHYVGRLWQHFLPSTLRHESIQSIGHFIKSFDVIALQEVDAGSFRTGFHDQGRMLSQIANMKYWHVQTNRDLGFWAQHSNAVLSRLPLTGVVEHSLPGLLPGRGAIEVDIQFQGQVITVFIAHLSLGKRAQKKQLAYLSEQIQSRPNCILMGDLNATSQWLLENSPLMHTNLVPQQTTHTYPSWKPKKDLDHILVSGSLEVSNFHVLNHDVSDHLPIALDVRFK